MTRAKKLAHIQSGVPSHSTDMKEKSTDGSPIGTCCRNKVRHRKSAEALARGARTSGLAERWDLDFRGSSAGLQIFQEFLEVLWPPLPG
ncbi:hypothetical protein D9M70_632700 [compost metagenome]